MAEARQQESQRERYLRMATTADPAWAEDFMNSVARRVWSISSRVRTRYCWS